jgi:hypothetical protein
VSSLWVRISGATVVAAGVVWIRERSVGVGIEGQEPAYFVRGRGALALGVVAIALGLFMLVFASKVGEMLGMN